MFFRGIFLGKLNNFLHLRTLCGIILRVRFSEKVHKFMCTFVKKKFKMHSLPENDIARGVLMINDYIY